MWELSLPDWQDRIRAGRTLVPELPLFEEDARRAVEIMNRLRLPDVPGQPYLRDALGDWFRDCARALFGSYDEKAAERYIRELFLLVPKKSSKTTGGAALMLTAMLVSKRPRAEFLLVAPTQEVSELAFRQALGMIEIDPVLSAKCHVQVHIKKITYRPTGCSLKVKSFDPKIVTGTKPAGVLLDELHVIAESSDADRVIGQLRGGLISQPEGFLVTITTQSERQPAGVFKAELQKARAVRDGRLKAPILPVLYEFPKDVDWKDSANWKMVTPNHGRSVTVERLVPDYEQAVAAGEAELRRWASQHLNVEIGVALATDHWVGALYWQAQERDGLTLDEVIARSEVMTVGIDGGGEYDLFGLAALGRDRDTGTLLSWTHAWLQESELEKRPADAAKLRDMEAEGSLTIINSVREDIAQIAEYVAKINASGLLARPDSSPSIGVDQLGLGDMLDKLHEAGIEPEQIVGVHQGYKLMIAIQYIERRLKGREIFHAPTQLMRWCVSNARVKLRSNAIMIEKESSGRGKIDPLMALFNAATLMALNPASQGKSFWEVEEAAA